MRGGVIGHREVSRNGQVSGSKGTSGSGWVIGGASGSSQAGGQMSRHGIQMQRDERGSGQMQRDGQEQRGGIFL